jgi:dipeptidyl aminopeptidase/acylaminoacyl peptidase
MTDISHEQARQFLLAAADNLLTDAGQAALRAHLAQCAECRAYAGELDALKSGLRAAFSNHWNHQGQSVRQLVPSVQAQSRRISMRYRFTTRARVLAEVVIVLALVITLNYIIAQRPQVSARSTQVPTSVPTHALQPTPVSTSLLSAISTPVIAATTTPTSLRYENTNRLIALALNNSGNSDIYVMHIDGSGLTDISNDPSIDRSPVWSPDGKRLAFESNRSGNFDIYVMNVDGSGLTNISNDPAEDSLEANQWQNYSPWSPDSRQVIFKSNRGGKAAWYVAGIDAVKRVIKLSDSDQIQAFWSPNGQKIATMEGAFGVYVVRADGTDRRVIQNKRSLQNNRSMQNVNSCSILGWLPDGQNIYIECEASDGQWTILQVNTQAGSTQETSTILQLTFPPAVDGFWMGRDASLGYTLREDSGDSFSLYRIENGKSVLSGKEEVTCASFYRFSIMSHTSGQQLSAMQCDGANIIKLWAQNLKDGASQVVGELDTGLQPGSSLATTGSTAVEWSRDDQFVLTYISTELLAQIYVIGRNDLNFPHGILKPVFTSQDQLVYSQPVIQPVNVPTQVKP